MAGNDAETVRRAYEHLDEAGAVSPLLVDSEVEFSFAWMDGRGIEAWNRAIDQWSDTFEEWRMEPKEFIDAGPGQVVAIVRDRARLKGSQAEIDNEFAHLWTLRGGRVIRFEAFTEREGALEAAASA